MKKVYSIIFLLIFLACSSNQDIEWEGIPIEKTKALDLMIDLSLAESAIATYKTDEKDSIRQVYQYQIERVHKMPMERIDSILQLIYKIPKINATMQTDLLDSLKAMEERSKSFK